MMKVHKDLFMYQRGVYATSGLTREEPVSHSVRILGWGEEDTGYGQPTKYWVSIVLYEHKKLQEAVRQRSAVFV
ncbi:Tubulointerstitial nephritis antigen-like [Portunus trituberculatus]|uniref:Tubulointerstitial nephritis antigen-like n=1 Tax=Portunus trituberculatus TaxID=210409 RepID=A0A5B7K5V3_PORTR|nr:Tubulointerstitial nephritis antigen-like [Portunus trituberculatus]